MTLLPGTNASVKYQNKDEQYSSNDFGISSFGTEQKKRIAKNTDASVCYSISHVRVRVRFV